MRPRPDSLHWRHANAIWGNQGLGLGGIGGMGSAHTAGDGGRWRARRVQCLLH